MVKPAVEQGHRIRHDEASSRPCDAGGASTVSVVLMLPVLILLLFAAVQAALWNHARTNVRVAARATAAQVARAGANPGDAQRDAEANLRRHGDLTNVHVTVTLPTLSSGTSVLVKITAQAPGIVIGTSSGIEVSVALPLEGWSPL